MRRARYLAMLGLLTLAACGEQAPQAPTSPDGGSPAFDKGVPCPTTAFPFDAASQQIKDLYPNGSAENSMVARAFDISKKWSQCKVADPQGKVGTFVQTLLQDFLANRLNVFTSSPTTAERVSALIQTMYEGVGLSSPNIPLDQLAPGGDIGVGLFVPGQALLVRTSTRNAGTKIPGNAFNQNTLITIYRLRDNADPLDTESQQSPPYYDINASNSSETHDLNGYAPLGICVDEASIAEFFSPAIGHNRLVPGEAGFYTEFEVLDPITAAEFASLGLTCTTLVNPATSASLDSQSTLGDLALGAWMAAQSAAADLFLPQPAYAASSVGVVGVGGRASSYSPFGIVDDDFYGE